MSQDIPIDIFLGLDVGKSQHHACALDKNGIKVFDKPLPPTRIRVSNTLR